MPFATAHQNAPSEVAGCQLRATSPVSAPARRTAAGIPTLPVVCGPCASPGRLNRKTAHAEAAAVNPTSILPLGREQVDPHSGP